ncbi:hypothetical protein L227DRAFT_633021 [Lentinus tigrinus ALCF2SS1-6]|uniref:Uncharacterized protein n=1 Tax=Lentinus tigrinus ALCF2SS1-6 TaxID=1328759 RepID=A0A5C2S2E0_9APHY|nr:hypothetical protein L227DRAFT_633021 [Lentinus tigrinus ALCF2SS1-6]
MPPRDNMPGGVRKPYNPDRRCHWFDNNGRPYKRLDGGLGCPRIKTCYFAHPTDGEHWRNSRPSGEPPLQYLTDDEYRLIVGRHRSPGRALPPDHPVLNRRRSLSADRRRRERERELARRRSASREREPTLASRLRGRPPSPIRERADGRPVGYRSSRSRSPQRARMQRTPPDMSGAPRAPRPYGSLPDGPKNVGPSGSPLVFPKVEAQDVPMRDVVNRQPGARESSIASSHDPHRPTPSRAIPNAPHAMTAMTASAMSTSPASIATAAPTSDAINSLLESSTVQWQQISSAVAAATSAVPKPNDPNATVGDFSSEEKHKIWTSRIELLAAATRIHNDCRTMDNDIKDYKQLVDSFSYGTLPAEDRTVIEGHLHTLQSQLGQKSDELKKILTQLTAAKFWPTHTTKQPPGSGQETVNAEIASQIQTLKGSVSQLHTMLQAVRTRWDEVLAKLQSDGNSSANTFLAEAIVPTELEKIRDTLTSIEERLGSVENEVTRPKEVFLEQVDAIVAENAQSVILASTGNVHAQPPAPRAALTDEQLKMLQILQQNAAATAQQVNQLSKQVTQLAAHNDQLKTESMQLQGENAQLRQQLEEAKSSQGDSKKIDRMQAEMRALNAAVMAYISHSPNAAPANPTADTLAQQITPQIVKSIPELIAPELQAMRNQLQETLRIQQSESAKELSLKMSLTLQAVEAIRGLVGGMHKSPRPTAAATHAAQVNGNPSS